MTATKHLATLQFRADGPAVEAEWTVVVTAQRRYAEWVGLYGTDPAVVIKLIEETGGRRRVRKTWAAQGETEEPAT
ncbi:hypothetical protein GCM10017744_104830 [Streptomyces antimycoticus]|uniref:Uncharacterized protein n=1 Tax=Streptomyces antimycoticus TaxID=68175 RepID=A0A4D4KRY3_9ACTN|nr:hypothetical protein [Streptomyces antimycoticus]GDY49208.1 hypothetical protein SANT12839_100900 [Streptomyces antimycoticus]